MHELNLILVIVYYIIVVLAVVHVVMDNRQPAKTMAWTLVIWFVPIVGIVFYLFFGVNTRKERMVSQRSLDELSKRSMLGFVEQQDLQLPDEYKPVIDLFINQSLSLPFKGSEVEVYTDGYQFFPALLSAIAGAKNHIHLDMYIFEDDALGYLIADMLIDKAREGVEVRVIYDNVGCWSVKNEFFERMREEGIEVVTFLPVRGVTGFMGGMNIALRYVKGTNGQPWRDTMVRMTGTGVYALQRAFLIDWYFADRTLLNDRKYYPNRIEAKKHGETMASGSLLQIVTSSPVVPYPEIMQGFVRTILAAKHYVYIETPYFLPTESVLFALKTAAMAGVDVRIMVPLKNDSWFVDWAGRSYLREAAEAGVRVLLYEAGFLHSKMLVCDDSISTCGSTNVDFRSFENNFEANVFFYGEDSALQLKQVFLTDEAKAVDLTDVPDRMQPKFGKRLCESVLRMLAPLM